MTENTETTARVGPLDTVGHVAHELGRLYRAARRGDLRTADAVRLAGILKELRGCLEGAEAEAERVEDRKWSTWK